MRKVLPLVGFKLYCTVLRMRAKGYAICIAARPVGSWSAFSLPVAKTRENVWGGLDQREGMGLLEYVAIFSMRDVIHDMHEHN
jgi:hypothetical protein